MINKIYNFVLSVDYKKLALALTILAILLGTDGPPNT
jgi:hypothetical protein